MIKLRGIGIPILVLGVWTLLGCVTPTHYTWKDYDNKLYKFYTNPTVMEDFVRDLKEVVAAGEETGKVPPGIYAELAYALYQQGSYEESIVYFQKESDKWPESKSLMTKMIENARKSLK